MYARKPANLSKIRKTNRKTVQVDAYDEGSPVDIMYMYLDFQKAFDKVPHQRLILKLKSHGIGISIHPVINWIGQWLTDTIQRVVQSNPSGRDWAKVTLIAG